MTVARDDFEALAKDRLHQLRVENVDWRALANDSSVRDCDYPRAEGRREIQVVEHGTHGELLRNSKRYRELLALEAVA